VNKMSRSMMWNWKAAEIMKAETLNFLAD